MDDVATIQKINAMSQELKHHGFYDTTQECVDGAKEIFDSVNEEQNIDLLQKEDVYTIEALSTNFNKYRRISDLKMQQLCDAITALENQISEMKNTVSIKPFSTSKTTLEPETTVEKPAKIQPTPENISKEETQEKLVEERQGSYNERQGNFTSEDVKIEDFFYYGNK